MSKQMQLPFHADALVKSAHTIIQDAIAEHKPIAVYVAYSGGRDSAIVLDVVHKSGIDYEVMAIDTELAADGWRDMVTRHCSVYGKSPVFVTGKGWRWYEADVLNRGFGYTYGHHAIYYQNLKRAAMERLVRDVKTNRRDRVMFLTGVRRSESVKRRNAPIVFKRGSMVSVNPILYFTQNDCSAYHDANLSWYSNPYYSTGASGDCYCGWTNTASISQVCTHSPLLANRLAILERESIANGGWAYNGVPPAGMFENDDTEMPIDALCINCTRKR